MIEIRLSPDGWIAQFVPPVVVSEEASEAGKRWLCMSWENGLARADLFTDAEVADWQVIYRDESWIWRGLDVG